jgi:hypothetical protein
VHLRFSGTVLNLVLKGCPSKVRWDRRNSSPCRALFHITLRMRDSERAKPTVKLFPARCSPRDTSVRRPRRLWPKTSLSRWPAPSARRTGPTFSPQMAPGPSRACLSSSWCRACSSRSSPAQLRGQGWQNGGLLLSWGSHLPLWTALRKLHRESDAAARRAALRAAPCVLRPGPYRGHSSLPCFSFICVHRGLLPARATVLRTQCDALPAVPSSGAVS